MKPFYWQSAAIKQLVEISNYYLKGKVRGSNHLSILKSPTGSGKTFMVQSAINEITSSNDDVSFVWLSFNDNNAMQSRNKLKKYFNNSGIKSLTHRDIQVEGSLKPNDCLFINWQKLVSNDPKNRLLRKPKDLIDYAEGRVYFDDFINVPSKVILVIDESHIAADTKLAKEIIELINPKLIIKISATPKDEDLKITTMNDTLVSVSEDDAANSGILRRGLKLINKFDDGKDIIDDLIRESIVKRSELSSSYSGDVNPLVLIQVPNDDKFKFDSSEKYSNIVRDKLVELGVEEHDIAIWLSEEKVNLNEVEDEKSEIKFLIFKEAASTGWDAPRAQILVMLRPLKSNSIKIQTIGRIMRIPGCLHDMDIESKKVGYILTDIEKNTIIEAVNKDKTMNKVKLNIANTIYMNNFQFDREYQYISRADYGDIGSAVRLQEFFKEKLIDSIKADTINISGNELSIENSVTTDVLKSDGKEHIEFTSVISLAETEKHTLTDSELSKMFNAYTYNILKDNMDSTGIKAIERSWTRLKSAIYTSFKGAGNITTKQIISTTLKDFTDSKIIYEKIISTLVDYKPVLDEEVKKRQLASINRRTFNLKEMYYYPSNYEEIEGFNNCILDKVYMDKEKLGYKNELSFMKIIDTSEHVDLWFKQEVGEEFYSVKYDGEIGSRLFYPDFIVKLKNGKFIVCDTKSGFTLDSAETLEKLKGLKEFNKLDITCIVGKVGQNHFVFETTDELEKQTKRIDINDFLERMNTPK